MFSFVHGFFMQILNCACVRACVSVPVHACVGTHCCSLHMLRPEWTPSHHPLWLFQWWRVRPIASSVVMAAVSAKCGTVMATTIAGTCRMKKIVVSAVSELVVVCCLRNVFNLYKHWTALLSLKKNSKSSRQINQQHKHKEDIPVIADKMRRRKKWQKPKNLHCLSQYFVRVVVLARTGCKTRLWPKRY